MKKTRFKVNPRHTPLVKLSSMMTALAFLFMPLTTLAGNLPTGPTVVNGGVHVTTSGQQMMINQATGKAIVNWESFSIGQGYGVNVQQPGDTAAMLSRVVGADPSKIMGALTANGIFYLVNPNGVFFGQNATVDVAQLIASTLDISNQDFLNGNLEFSGDSMAAVENAGVINADMAALIGQKVVNAGTIQAQQTALAAASNVHIANVAGGNLSVDLTGLLGDVENTGTVDAGNGGAIEMSGANVTIGDVNVPNGSLTIDPQQFDIRDGSGTTAANEIYEVQLETLLQGGTDVTIEAWDAITVNSLTDGLLDGTGADANLTLRLTDDDADGTGIILFQNNSNEIALGTGTLTLDAQTNTPNGDLQNIGMLSVNGGSIVLLAGGNISLDNDITLSAIGGQLTVNSTTGAIEQSLNSAVATNNRPLTYTAPSIAISGTINTGTADATFDGMSGGFSVDSAVSEVTSTGDIYVIPAAGTNIDLAYVAGSGAYNISDNTINNLSTSGTLYIGDTATGNITIGAANPAQAAFAVIRSGGNILDDGSDSTGIVADDVTLLSDGGFIGTDAAPVGIDTGSGNITAITTAANGDIHLVEFNGNLNLTNVDIDTDDVSMQTVQLAVSTLGGTILTGGATFADLAGQTDNLVLSSDTMTIGDGITVDTSRTVTLRPYTSGRGIDIGGTTANTLQLADADLDVITDGGAGNIEVVIGRATSGQVLISGAGAAIGPDDASILTIISGQDITDDGIAGTVLNTLGGAAGSTITLDSQTGIYGVAGTNANNLQIDADNLAARVQANGAANDLRVYRDGSLQLVDPINASSSFDGRVTGGNNVDIEVTGALTRDAGGFVSADIKSARDVVLRAADGMGTAATPLRTDVDDTAVFAAVNTTTGGIFIEEQNINLTVETAEESNAGPGVTGVTNAGTGAISIVTVDGDLIVRENVVNGAPGASITLQAGGQDNLLELDDANGGVAVTTAGGDVILIADNMTIDDNAAVDLSAGGNVFITPDDLANVNVQIGGTGARDAEQGTPDLLDLTEGELNEIITGAMGGIIIGSQADMPAAGDQATIMDGTITVTGALDLTLAGGENLALVTDSTDPQAIFDGAVGVDGGFAITANVVLAHADGGIDITTNMNGTAADNIIQAISYETGDVIIDDLGAIAGTGQLMLTGISTQGSNIIVQTHSDTVVTGSGISAGGTGFVALEVEFDDLNSIDPNNDTLIIAAPISTVDGDIHLVADQPSLQDSVSAGGTGLIYITHDTDADAGTEQIILGTDVGAVNNLELTQADLLNLAAGGNTVVIGSAALTNNAHDGIDATDMTVADGSITLTANLDLTTAAFDNLYLMTEDDITDAGAFALSINGKASLEAGLDGTGSITGSSTSGTIANSLNINSTSISAESAGDVFLIDTAGGLTVDSQIAGVIGASGNGGVRSGGLAGDDIILESTGGHLVISNVVTAGAGNVFLQTTGAGNDILTTETLNDTTVDYIADNGYVVQGENVGLDAAGAIGADNAFNLAGYIITRVNDTGQLAASAAGGGVFVVEDAAGLDLVLDEVADPIDGGAISGVTAALNSDIKIYTADGDLTVDNTGGSPTTVQTTGTGLIELSAGLDPAVTGAVDHLFTKAGGATISVANTQIDLTADNMNLVGLAGSQEINAGTGVVTLVPLNLDSHGIAIGDAADADGDQELDLTAAELNTIEAGVVVLGSAAMQGPITVTAATDLDVLNTADNLTLITGNDGQFAVDGEGFLLSETGTLTVDADGGIRLDTEVGTLAAIQRLTTGVEADIDIDEQSDLIIGTAIAPSSAFAGVITNTDTAGGGDIDIQTGLGGVSGDLTVNQSILAGNDTRGTGSIVLAGNNADDTLTVNAPIRTFDGTITLSYDNLVVNAAVDSTTGGGANRIILQPNTGGNVVDIHLGAGATDAAGVLAIDDTELANIATDGVLQIGNTEVDDIDVVGTAAIPNAPVVHLIAGDEQGDAGVNPNQITNSGSATISVQTGTGDLALSAAGSIGTAVQPIMTDVAVIAAAVNDTDSSDAGGIISLQEQADGVTVGTVDGVVGLTTQGGTDGDIILHALDDGLDAAEDDNIILADAIDADTSNSGTGSVVVIVDDGALLDATDDDVFDIRTGAGASGDVTIIAKGVGNDANDTIDIDTANIAGIESSGTDNDININILDPDGSGVLVQDINIFAPSTGDINISSTTVGAGTITFDDGGDADLIEAVYNEGGAVNIGRRDASEPLERAILDADITINADIHNTVVAGQRIVISTEKEDGLLTITNTGDIFSNSGDIVLRADNMFFDTTGGPGTILVDTAVNDAGGDIFVVPADLADVDVILSGASGANTANNMIANVLDLSEAEMQSLRTHTGSMVYVGTSDATKSPATTIDQEILLTDSLNFTPNMGSIPTLPGRNLVLITDSASTGAQPAIFDGTAGVDNADAQNSIAAEQLSLIANGDIDMSAVLEDTTTADTVVAATSASGDVILDLYNTTAPQQVATTLDGNVGITAAGFVVLQASGDTLTINDAIAANGPAGSGFVVIEQQADDALLTINAPVTSSSDDIHVASDNLDLAADLTVNAGQSIYVMNETIADTDDVIYIGAGAIDQADGLGLTDVELRHMVLTGGGAQDDAAVIGRATTALDASDGTITNYVVNAAGISIVGPADLSTAATDNYTFVTDGPILNVAGSAGVLTINGTATLDAGAGIGLLDTLTGGLNDAETGLDEDYANWFGVPGDSNYPILLQAGDGNLDVAALNRGLVADTDIAIALLADGTGDVAYNLATGIEASTVVEGVQNLATDGDVALWLDPANNAIYNPSGSLGVGSQVASLTISKAISTTGAGDILIDAGIGTGADDSFTSNGADPNAVGDVAKGGGAIHQLPSADITSDTGNITIVVGNDDDTDAASMVNNDLEFLIGFIGTAGDVTIRFDGNVRDNNGGGLNIQANNLFIDNAPEFNDQFGADGDEIEVAVSGFSADVGELALANNQDLIIIDPNLDGDNNPETWPEDNPGDPADNSVGVRTRRGGIIINVGNNNLTINGAVMARTDDTHAVPNSPVPGADIKFVAGGIDINASVLAGGYDAVNDDAGNITIEPGFISQDINIGHNPNSSGGGLNLTQREINFLRTGQNATLTIGLKGGTGDVTIGWNDGGVPDDVLFDNQVQFLDDSAYDPNQLPVTDLTSYEEVYGDRTGDGLVTAADLTEGPAGNEYRFGGSAAGTPSIVEMPNVTIRGGETTFVSGIRFYTGQTVELDLTGAVIDAQADPAIETAADAEIYSWDPIAAAADSTGTALFTAVGGIGTVAEDIDIAVANVAALNQDVVNQVSAVNITNTGALTNNGVINNDAGLIQITASSPQTVTGDQITFGNGDIILTATEDGGNDDTLTIASDVTIKTDQGDIILNAGQNIDLQSGVLVQTGGDGLIDLNADDADGADGDGQITMADTALIQQTGIGEITLNADAALSLTNIDAGGDITVASNGGATISLSGDITSDTGIIDFEDAVDVVGETLVSSSEGEIIFQGDVSGANSLEVSAPIGTATFGSTVGAMTPLTELLVTAESTSFAGAVNAATVTLHTDVDNGATALDINASTLLELDGNLTASSIALDGSPNIDLLGDTQLNATAGSIDLTGGAVDGTFELTLTAAGDVSLGGVGQSDALQQLIIAAGATTNFQDSVSVLGDIVVDAEDNINILNSGTVISAGAEIVLNGGSQAGDAVTAAGGTLVVAGSSLLIEADALTLADLQAGAGMTLASTGGDIGLNGAVQARDSLNVDAAGAVIMGATGGLTAGANLNVTAGTDVTLAGLGVDSGGNVLISAAGNVNVNTAVTSVNDTTILADNSITTLAGGLIATGRNLVLSTDGVLELNAATAADGSILLEGNNGILLGTDLQAGGAVTVQDDVTLTSNVQIVSDNGDIELNDLVIADSAGAQSLTLLAQNGAVRATTLGTGANYLGALVIDGITAQLDGDIHATSIDTTSTGLTFLTATDSATPGELLMMTHDGGNIDLGPLAGAGLRIDAEGNVTFDDANIAELNVEDALDVTFGGDFVTAGDLIVGPDVTGTVQVTSDGSLQAGGELDLSGGNIDVDGGIGGGGITLTGALGDVTIDGQAIEVGGGGVLIVTTNGNIEIAQTADASLTSENADIVLSATNGSVLLGTTTTVGELQAKGTAGDIAITAGNAFAMGSAAGTKVKAGGLITINAATATVDGSGLLAEEAVNVTTTGALDVNALIRSTDSEIVLTADSATIDGELRAQDDVTATTSDLLDVNALVRSSSGTIRLAAIDTDGDGGAVVDVGADLIAANVEVTAQDGDSTSEQVIISAAINNTAGNITLDADDGTVDVDASVTADGDININTLGGNGITQLAGGADLLADGDITIDDTLNLDGALNGISTIESTDGDVAVTGVVTDSTNGRDLFLNAVDGTVAVNQFSTTRPGADVTVNAETAVFDNTLASTVADDLTINVTDLFQNGGAGLTVGDEVIVNSDENINISGQLTAGGPLSFTAGELIEVDADLHAGALMTLQSDRRIEIGDGSPVLVSGDDRILITADADGDGNGSVVMADNATIRANNVVAVGPEVRIEGVNLVIDTIEAAGGEIELAAADSILGTDGEDDTADLTAALVDLDAGSGVIGTVGAALDISADTIEADTLGNGGSINLDSWNSNPVAFYAATEGNSANITLDHRDGGELDLVDVRTADGNITVTSDADVTATLVDANGDGRDVSIHTVAQVGTRQTADILAVDVEAEGDVELVTENGGNVTTVSVDAGEDVIIVTEDGGYVLAGDDSVTADNDISIETIESGDILLGENALNAGQDISLVSREGSVLDDGDSNVTNLTSGGDTSICVGDMIGEVDDPADPLDVNVGGTLSIGAYNDAPNFGNGGEVYAIWALINGTTGDGSIQFSTDCTGGNETPPGAIIFNGVFFGGPQDVGQDVLRNLSFAREIPNYLEKVWYFDFLYFPHAYAALPTIPDALFIEFIIYGTGVIEGLPEGVEPTETEMKDIDDLFSLNR